jgi:hypothetical protein
MGNMSFSSSYKHRPYPSYFYVTSQKTNTMETLNTQSEVTQQDAINQLYNFTANLLVNEKRTSEEVKTALVEKGLSEDAAYTIVNNLENEIYKAKKDRATKDMIYGALWCVGGTVATLANIGFIFWGAILFGGVQFIKGLVNSLSND